MTTPREKDQLWAEFQRKTGADRHSVSGKSLVIGLVVLLLLVGIFWLR